jgi:type IV pilus assembly protein PilE
MKTNLGFSLIELMVTIAIIGILAAIALPNYNAYVIKSKITEATSGLSDYRVKLEQFYQDNRNYGAAGAATCGNAGNPPVPTGQYFTFTCAVGGGGDQTFRATATNNATGGLGPPGSYVFDINESNQRRTTAFTGDTGLPKNCWITVKSQTC